MDNCRNYSILYKKLYIVISYATQQYFLSIKALHHNFLYNATIFSLWKVKTILDKTLRKNNYFEIETGAKHEVMNDTNYDSNYNEIFKNNSLELDGQTPPIDELDTQLDSRSSSETDN